MKKLIALLTFLFSVSLIFAQGTKEESIKTVTIWHSHSGSIGEAFDDIVEDFNDGYGKENNIRIEAIYQGKANDVLTKVKANINSGDKLPEIACLDATAALDMSTEPRVVTPEDLGIDTSRLVEQALEAYRSDKLLALPFNASALVLYYNKTLFDEKGLNAPKTIDDIIAISPTLKAEDKDGNITRYALQNAPTTYELTSFIGTQNGYSYFVNNKNGHLGTPTEVLLKKDGTFKAFLEKWKALYETGALNNTPSGASAEFAAGRTAMILASSSNLKTIENAIGSSFELGLAGTPTVNIGDSCGAAVGGGALFAYSSGEEVKAVLEYLISKEVQFYFSSSTGYIPVNLDVYQMDEYKSYIEKNPLSAVASDIILNSDKNIVNVWLPSAYQIYYSFQENINGSITGKKTIDKSVDDMASVIEGALKDYAKQNSN